MVTNKHPFSAPEALQIALRGAGIENDADRIFYTIPSLHTVALQFCRYVSPFIEMDGQSVLQMAFNDAVSGFMEHEPGDTRQGIHLFIARLAKYVDVLCRVRLSVQTEDGAWVIWQYDEPVYDWMAAHGRKAVQIRLRSEPVEKGPIVLKLLSYMCSVRDLQIAKLDLSTLV